MMTKSQFWKLSTPKQVRTKVMLGVVLCYISAGLTLVVALGLGLIFLLDVALLLGLGLGIHIAKSRVCACVLTGYYILSKLLQPLMGMGDFNALSIVMIIVYIGAYVSCIIGTFQFQKLWKDYVTGAAADYGDSQYVQQNDQSGPQQ